MGIDAILRAMPLWLKQVCALLSAETTVRCQGSPHAQNVTGTVYGHCSATSSGPFTNTAYHFCCHSGGAGNGPIRSRICTETLSPHPKRTINTNRCSIKSAVTSYTKTSDTIYWLATVCNKNGVKLVKDVPRIKFLYQLWVSRFPSDREYDTGFYCKREQAWKCSIVNGKQCVFFWLCCTSNLTPLPYVPARNRTIINFSWQHHDVMFMGEAQDHKLEIVMHYNDNWKREWRPRQDCERIYCMRSTGHWNL